MAHIVCGRFDRTVDADAALAELRSAGYADSNVDAFYVSPPGQHDLTPVGGDATSSEGSRAAGKGSAIGAVIGALAGLAIGALLFAQVGMIGLLAAGALGAYVGAFAGAMAKVRGGKRSQASVEHPVEPRGGRMIAVSEESAEKEREVAQLLRRHNARNIGRADGEWHEGQWRDFDPRKPLEAI